MSGEQEPDYLSLENDPNGFTPDVHVRRAISSQEVRGVKELSWVCLTSKIIIDEDGKLTQSIRPCSSGWTFKGNRTEALKSFRQHNPYRGKKIKYEHMLKEVK